MNYRINSRAGWDSIVDGLLNARGETLAHCRRTIVKTALSELTHRGYDVQTLKGDSTLPELRELAEVADNQYLHALDSSEGSVDSEVMNRFGIARALAALAFVGGGEAATEILEGAYELAVVSSEVEAGLQRDLTAALGN